MGAPIGNQNAREGRIWRDTLRRALLAEDGKNLRKIADALVAKAADGDVAAIKEIGDRVDGKAVQSVELTGADGGPVKVDEVRLVPLAGVER